MELKVGMKAIIVNSQHHAEYNFQKCEIKSIENKKCVWVLSRLDNCTSRFCVAQNELIPLVYENPEDLKKYGTTVEDMAECFAEYRGYYECMCRICDGLDSDLIEKDEKHRQEIKEKDCQIAEMQHHIDCLEADKSELRTRCKESATDSFDKHLYGLLNIVGEEDLKTHAGDFPEEPIKVAEMLIYARGTYKTNSMERAFGAGDTGTYDIYSVSDLRQIAEHLLVYCNANSDEE